MTREAFVKEFQEKLLSRFPNGFQHWYPNFIFHYSHIENIVSILNSGKLYSREKALETGVMQNDNADDEVIDHTIEKYKKYARFYFGAKTPTQYHNEGIKPQSQISNRAHCPVPVFLLFDFVKLLSKEDTEFSAGNIAAEGTVIYDCIEQLDDLEFEYIYDRNALPNENYRGHIIYCRHAEVLVKNELEVYDFLKFVCIRSEAEKETLLYLVDYETKRKISGKLKVFTKPGIFYSNRLFVEKVWLEEDHIVISFSNAGSHTYTLRGIAKNVSNGKVIDKMKADWKIPGKIRFMLVDLSVEEGIEFTLFIDGNRVYTNILYRSKEKTV